MFHKTISLIAVIAFTCSSLAVPPQAQAHSLLDLPEPGTMVSLSPAYTPALIKGLTVHKDNPFLFDFIVDTGNSQLAGDALKKEGDRLIKYFFASLTIPDKDLWVNLSPYEKDRMIPQALGQTAMGRDLLAQDYMLKQLTASLIYPEKELGKNFWDKIYAQAREQFGTTNIPVNTFNKVWIVAEKASVYEHDQTAFIVSGHLKVMLEEDYLALTKHITSLRGGEADGAISKRTTNTYEIASPSARNDTHSVATKIIREVILPALEHEVNTGKNFAMLRQIFYSQILATWFKRNLKQALLSQVYADKSTVKGVNLQDPSIKEKIYQRYLQAYKKGAYNYIKEETDPVTQQTFPRKYFSGGYEFDQAVITDAPRDKAQLAASDMAQVVELRTILNTADQAMGDQTIHSEGIVPVNLAIGNPHAVEIPDTQFKKAKSAVRRFLQHNQKLFSNPKERLSALDNVNESGALDDFIISLWEGVLGNDKQNGVFDDLDLVYQYVMKLKTLRAVVEIGRSAIIHGGQSSQEVFETRLRARNDLPPIFIEQEISKTEHGRRLDWLISSVAGQLELQAKEYGKVIEYDLKLNAAMLATPTLRVSRDSAMDVLLNTRIATGDGVHGLDTSGELKIGEPLFFQERGGSNWGTDDWVRATLMQINVHFRKLTISFWYNQELITKELNYDDIRIKTIEKPGPIQVIRSEYFSPYSVELRPVPNQSPLKDLIVRYQGIFFDEYRGNIVSFRFLDPERLSVQLGPSSDGPRGQVVLFLDAYNHEIIIESTVVPIRFASVNSNDALPAGHPAYEHKGGLRVIEGRSSNKAMITHTTDGGIDLNTLNNGLSVTKDANGGVTIAVDPAMIERVRHEGIERATPVIISMKFLPSMDQLLGF